MDTPPQALDIILEGGKQKKFELAQISKASTGVILRGTKEKSFTPLTVVMDAAGIPKNSRIRIKGSDNRQNELLLQRNAPPMADPNDYGFIFNPDGFAHLAHKPGPPKPEGTPTERWPEVKQVVSIEVVPATPGKYPPGTDRPATSDR